MSRYDMLTYLGFPPPPPPHNYCELSYCISNPTEIRTQKDRFKSYTAAKNLNTRQLNGIPIHCTDT